MDSFDDILRNSITYLHKISEAMNNNLPSVKSFYATKSRILELKYNAFLPGRMTNSTTRCPRCCLSFEDYTPSIRLKPTKKVSKFTKKVIRKMRDNKPLTLYQLKHSRFEKSADVDHNILGKTCSICKKEAEVVIKKPRRVIQQVEKCFIKTPAKKKKRKDRFCGLNQSAVLASSKKPKKKERNIPVQSKMPAKTENENSQHKLLNILEKPTFNSTKEEKEEITTPIKYNLFGRIEQKSEKQKKSRKKQKNPKMELKTRKQKMKEKRYNKRKLKDQNNLKSIFSNSGKSGTSTALSNFLKDL